MSDRKEKHEKAKTDSKVESQLQDLESKDGDKIKGGGTIGS